MASLLPIIALAIVQGITEFLPISSSGHLVLTWEIFEQAGVASRADTANERLTLDVAVHLGSLGAVLLYFRRDVTRVAVGGLRLLAGRTTDDGRLFLYLVVATVPLVAAGLLVSILFGSAWRSAEVVAWASLGFGLLLWFADRTGMTISKLQHTTFGQALVIGLVQVLALIPGASRSGVTMTAARTLGFERAEAATISMLLAIPAILGAAALFGHEIYAADNVALQSDALIAAAVALVAALAAIAGMMAWLRRATFTPFAVYRILLGGLLLYLIHVEGMELKL